MDALADYATLVLRDPEVSDNFRAVVARLDDDELVASLDELIRDAYQRMPSTRMLYIDASILKVLARASIPGLHEDGLRECISTLDHAIIIAGAAVDDTRRDYVVHDVIKRLQSAIPWRPPTSAILIAKAIPATVPHPLATSRNGIPALTTLPSLLAPGPLWSRAPFVVRRYADDWPAIHRWTSLSYLSSVAGPGRIVPVEVGHDYRSDEWSQKLIRWQDFLAALDPPPPEPLYLAQHTLFTQFPQLREDIFLPDIVYASLDSPDYPTYHPPRDVILNAWLGPKGTISPAHTDPFFNCYVQVVGRKTVWLAPPNVVAGMHPYQSSVADADKIHPRAVNATNPLMSNTSQVDVFCATLHDMETSQSAFPLFWDTVPDEASSVTLNPGDLLFFPPGWWHAMRSEDVSFSVSMWF